MHMYITVETRWDACESPLATALRWHQGCRPRCAKHVHQTKYIMLPSFRNCVAANHPHIPFALQQCVLCPGHVEPFGMPVTGAASESRCVPSSGTILRKHLEATQMCNDTTPVQSHDCPHGNATPCRSAHGPRMSHRRCPDQRRQARHCRPSINSKSNRIPMVYL